MSIDPRKLPRVYNDAHATLVPNSPLKDMQVDLDPGDASAGRLENGGTIPVAQTTSPIDSDELTAALDADSRTWLRSLIADLDTGTSGRGRDLRRLLGLLGPTAAQMRRLGDVLAARRHALARVVHNLGAITAAVAGHDAQLDAVVSAGDRTLHALAVQDVALRDAVTRLPSTLQVATATLTDLTGFSGQLGPTARALLPTARRLPQVLRDTQTLFQGAALLPLKQTPAFVAAVLPLARLIAPTTHDIGAQLPSLIRSFDVLSYVSNEIAYDSGPHPGFLYWLAWAAHDLNSFVSTQDADGGLWRLLTLFSCSNVQQNPLAGALAGILAVNQSTCP
jgi:phospholipid/cholesterol/gamma-HCH transport system substrate-binding protein